LKTRVPGLPRLLTGKDRPASAGECLDVVEMCRHKRPHAAAGFSADAFAADRKLADDLRAGHRYNAACDAALAGAAKARTPASLATRKRPVSADRPSTGSVAHGLFASEQRNVKTERAGFAEEVSATPCLTSD
jgi:hypothetical protein